VFKTYVLFLILSGIAMLIIAGVRTGQTKARRLWNGIFGAGFLGYGLYLLLIFHGGHYYIFFYAFILPILMIVQFLRDRGLVRARPQAGTLGRYGQPPPPGYGQPPPPGYGQPPPPGYGSRPEPASNPEAATEFSPNTPTAWEWTAAGGWQSGHGQPPAPSGYGQPSGDQPRDPAV
jgi:hypothetical protein